MKFTKLQRDYEGGDKDRAYVEAAVAEFPNLEKPVARHKGWAEKARYVGSFEYIANLLENTNKMYTILKHVSRSGMSRSIDVVVACDGDVRKITNIVTVFLEWKFDRNNGGVKIGGCGMDMGFHVVNIIATRMSYILYDKYDSEYINKIKQEWL